MQRERVTLGSFSIEVSQGWNLSTVILAGPEDEKKVGAGMPTTKVVQSFQRNIVATMEPVDASVTPEIYVKRQVEALKQAGVQPQVGAAPQRVQLASGVPAMITEQVISGANGERVRQMQLVCIKDGVAHTVIASHLDGPLFESARSDFRKMLVSFV